MRRLRDSVVVVTGASSGIGRAAAEAFADKGATVAVTARRQGALDSVVAECRERGADAIALPADVADAEAVENVAREVAGRYGRIDVWVNNAAVQLFGRVEETPVNVWYRVIETNLFGTYHGIRAALPWMREQGHGVIINVSSLLGKMGAPYMSSYVVSKHAIRGLSDCVRQELLDAPGIEVCTVLPGPIDTPLFTSAGNYTGREVKPIKPVISATRVADAIVSCARKPTRETIVGASTAAALGLNRLVPGMTERIGAKQVENVHFGDAPEAPTSGNVLEPRDGEATVSGGWTRSSKHVAPDDRRAASVDGAGRVRKLAAVGAVAAVGAGVAGVVRSRRS